MDKLDGTKGQPLTKTTEVMEEIVLRDLTFTLTEADFAEKGKAAGRTAAELRGLEDEFDTLKKEWKGRLDDKESDLSDIHATIRRGKETRHVKCVERKDFNANSVEYLFNGEVLESRAMGLEERQLTLVAQAKEARA